MSNIHSILATIDECRRRAGLSKAELARRIGVKPESVRRLFSTAKPNPTSRTLDKLCAALDLELRVVPGASMTMQPVQPNYPAHSTNDPHRPNRAPEFGVGLGSNYARASSQNREQVDPRGIANSAMATMGHDHPHARRFPTHGAPNHDGHHPPNHGLESAPLQYPGAQHGRDPTSPGSSARPNGYAGGQAPVASPGHPTSPYPQSSPLDAPAPAQRPGSTPQQQQSGYANHWNPEFEGRTHHAYEGHDVTQPDPRHAAGMAGRAPAHSADTGPATPNFEQRTQTGQPAPLQHGGSGMPANRNADGTDEAKQGGGDQSGAPADDVRSVGEHSSSGHQLSEHQLSGHQPSGHQLSGRQSSGHHAAGGYHTRGPHPAVGLPSSEQLGLSSRSQATGYQGAISGHSSGGLGEASNQSVRRTTPALHPAEHAADAGLAAVAHTHVWANHRDWGFDSGAC